MSITRLAGSVSVLAMLLGTGVNKIQNPNAPLTDDIPLVDAYKSVLSNYTRNVEDSADSIDKSDSPNHPAQSISRRHHFTHDRTGQSLDMGNGLETSGTDPLNRGPYDKTGGRGR